jgi:hypothetical protein
MALAKRNLSPQSRVFIGHDRINGMNYIASTEELLKEGNEIRPGTENIRTGFRHRGRTSIG